MDNAANTISNASESIFADVIKNLNNPSERGAFFASYRVLANEAYRVGLGMYGELSSSGNGNYVSSLANDNYKTEKERIIDLVGDGYNPYFANINFEQEYGKNNFKNITNLLDEMTDIAVNNMNSRQGLDLRSSDIRTIVELGFATHSLRAMDDLYNHKNCMMFLNERYAMQKAADEIFEQEQNQGMTY